MIRAENLTYTYPFQTAPALDGVSFEVAKGEALLVTGPSGCGKTTLLRLLNGLAPAHFKGAFGGTLSVAGMAFPRPLAEVSARVGTVLQNPDDQFLATTVEEEVAMALEWRGMPHGEMRARVDAALAELGIGHLAARSVFTLSQGEKQKCVIASILAAAPDVVVMDEPTANLSPDATADLARVVLDLKARGITVVIVDHRLYWLRGALDRLLVLNGGTRVFYATKETAGGRDPLDVLAADPRCAEFGVRAVTVRAPETRPLPPDTGRGVRVEGLTFRWPHGGREVYHGFSAAFPRGGIVSVTGANGAGKTTLARLVCGLLKPRAGTVRVDGAPLAARKLRARIAFVMQQMDTQLYMRTVREEVETSAPRGTSYAARRDEAERLLALFALAPLAARHPHSLSGGEKQRLVIACALMKRPDLIILDEPTSGLDGRNMRLIARELSRFAEGGGTVVIITHDLELVSLVASFELRIGETK